MTTYYKLLLLTALALYNHSLYSATLQVGDKHKLRTPSAAALVAKDGDIIEIDTGLYAGDTTPWYQNNLTIRATGGRAHMQAIGPLTEDKAIWVIKGNNTIVENIEFSGAKVDDHNGAGIRHEGTNLTLRKCYFHHNENGLLTNHNPDSSILIEHSEFFANGYGDGYTHNIYIGRIKSFKLMYSYSHGAIIGHQVKSRASQNFILYNRLMDQANGASSYILDLPNGGYSYVIGNILQQGPDADNYTMFSYGAEGGLHEQSKLFVANNTFVNDRHAGVFLQLATGLKTAIVANNLLVGNGKIQGKTNSITNLKTSNAKFVDAKNYNYRLSKKSPAINAGNDIGEFGIFSLTPTHQYVHPADAEMRPIAGKLDIGAYEFVESQ